MPVQLTFTQVIALILPVLLILSLLYAFPALHRRYGFPLGYLLGFGIYWIVWCLLFPAILLGGLPALAQLFHPVVPLTQIDWRTQLLLWWPVAFPLFMIFLPRLRKIQPRILFWSIVLGIVIGVTEEILWRGVYMRLFPGSVWLGILYPSIMFGLWHICPQTVHPNRMPGGVYSFVIYALLLGLSYALTVPVTGSIFWCTVSHALHDSLGLGAIAYSAWLSKLGRISPTSA